MKFSIILAAATTALSTSALAGPLLTITGTVNGFAPITVSSNGVATATTGRYSYVGGTVNTYPNPAWAISWNLLGDDSAVFSNSTFITNGFRVQNLTSSSQDFDIVVKLANPGPSGLQLSCNASLGGTITSDSASTSASITSGVATPMWVGQINGIDRAGTALLTNQSFSAAAAFTNSFGPSSGGWTGTVAGALADIGYRLRFTLGGNATAQFSGAWTGNVVPSPSAFALLAAVGAFGIRRRREAN
jgi:MYXO-CTERM domain-containing protein